MPPPPDEGEPPATTSIDLSTDSRTLQRDSADTDVPSPCDDKVSHAEALFETQKLELAPVVKNTSEAVGPGHAGADADLEKGGAEDGPPASGAGEKEANRRSTMSATGTMASVNLEAGLPGKEKGGATRAQGNNAESQMLTGMRLWTLFGCVCGALVLSLFCVYAAWVLTWSADGRSMVLTVFLTSLDGTIVSPPHLPLVSCMRVFPGFGADWVLWCASRWRRPSRASSRSSTRSTTRRGSQ